MRPPAECWVLLEKLPKDVRGELAREKCWVGWPDGTSEMLPDAGPDVPRIPADPLDIMRLAALLCDSRPGAVAYSIECDPLGYLARIHDWSLRASDASPHLAALRLLAQVCERRRHE